MQVTPKMDSVPRRGRSPGVGNGNPLKYSCLENSMDRGAWQAAVHGITKSPTDTHTDGHTHTQEQKIRKMDTHTHTHTPSPPTGAKDQKNGLKYHPA